MNELKIQYIVKTIAYIVGIIGFLSIFKHISPIYSSIFLALCLISIYFDYKKGFHIPRWFLNLAAIVVILLSLFRLNLDNLIVPAVEGLLMLLAIKFLEDKKFRDYMQIYLISLFLLSGSALLTIDIEFLVYFLIMIFLLTASMIFLTYYLHQPDLSLPQDTIVKIALKSMLIPLLSLPVAILLFITLPRASHPLFNFLNKPEKAKTGFTDNVKLGAVSSIQEDTTAIFRAHMEKIDERHLYWRGIVLDYFDGTSWHSIKIENEDQKAVANSIGSDTSQYIKQTIYLEPYENRYIFALDKPYSIRLKNIKEYADLTFSLQKNIDRRIKYDAISILSDTISETDIDKEAYLQLPKEISPEIVKLTKKITNNKDTEETIKAILIFLKSDNYKYSLKNLPISKTPLDDFLFKHKSGNCEYFASAMAVMLRISGIPARLVGGYIGGYYNEIGKYYFVPQKNAHVWIEAYIEEKGKWIKIDPTPTSLEGFVSSYRLDPLFRIRLAIDTINYYWNIFVIGYDIKKQLSLLYKIQSVVKKPEIKLSLNKNRLIKYFVIVVALYLSVFTFYKVVLSKKAKEEKLLFTFLRKMEKYGYKKQTSEGLEEFVARIKEKDLRQSAYMFVKEFESYYYKDKTLTKKDIKRLKSMLK